MKTAIYILEGLTQVVLTPETTWEKTALEGLKEKVCVEIKRGGFYHCHGGWDRQNGNDDSIMLRISDQIS